MAPSAWTTESERKLFLNIILLTAPKMPAWDKVATMMGDGKTGEACRQHFNKLKRESKSVSGSPTKATTTNENTPKSAKAVHNPTSKSRKRKAADFDADNADDEEDLLGKSVKCDPKKGKEVKAELVKDETEPLEEDNSLYD